jgi:hypothetical protein
MLSSGSLKRRITIPPHTIEKANNVPKEIIFVNELISKKKARTIANIVVTIVPKSGIRRFLVNEANCGKRSP